MTEALKHRGKIYFNATTACCCVFSSDKCQTFQEFCCQIKLTASKKAHGVITGCVYRRMHATAQSKNTVNRRKAHFVWCEITQHLFALKLIFSFFPSAALRCNGMTAADGNIGPWFLGTPRHFSQDSQAFPQPRCPVCARASCARAGMFISNLPAGRAPRCSAHRGSHPILLYHIML